jgi:hypothetical protein
MTYYQLEIPSVEILKEMEANLINPEEGTLLSYSQLISYFRLANTLSLSNTKESLMKIIAANTLCKKDLVSDFGLINNKLTRTMAIDFPIMLRSLNTNVKDVIMVVAMDPLPPNVIQDEVAMDQIGCWVPFSLIDSDTTGEKSFKSNRAFFLELLKKHHVYVTDIYKLFYREGNYPTDLRSNSLSGFTEIPNHKIILNKEIEVVTPKAIVTIGNSSRNAIYHMLGATPKPWDDVQICHWASTPIISIPHISGAANKSSSALLKKYPDIVGRKTEKLAKLVLHKLETLI